MHSFFTLKVLRFLVLIKSCQIFKSFVFLVLSYNQFSHFRNCIVDFNSIVHNLKRHVVDVDVLQSRKQTLHYDEMKQRLQSDDEWFYELDQI